MENITLKNIGGWNQLIFAGKYYEEKIIENGEGPSEVLVKVDYRTGSWHKPTTYYYKTNEGWAYGIMKFDEYWVCLLYTSPSPRDAHESRMPSSA